jgi:hypothetical protein
VRERKWEGERWRERRRRTQLESFKIIWILSNSIAVFYTQS